MDRLNSKNESGFSTLEILIAITVLTLALSAVVLLAFGNQSLLIDSQNSTEALGLAQKMIEQENNAAKLNFDTIQNSTTTDNDGGTLTFTKNIIVQDLDNVTKKVTAQVTWGDHLTKKVELYTIVTDLANGPGANTCSYVLSGNWTNPSVSNFTMTNLLNSGATVYPITDVDAYLGKLYVTASNPSGTKTQSTFFVFDLTAPTTPTVLAQIDNDNSVATGLAAVAVGTKYAYVASATTTKQLQIIDISVNPPSVVSSYTVPGSGIGNSIFYKNNYVYLGLSSPSGVQPGFNVIDVSNPATPTLVGDAVIGHTVNSIYVRDHYAYVASPDSNDLQIFDITPALLSTSPAMTPAGTFNGAGGSHGKSVLPIGTTIYLGRTFGTNEFYALNASTLSNITELGHLNISGAGASINGLEIRNNLAFFLTTSAGLQIWNIANPAAAVSYATTISMPASGSGVALDCEGNFLYAASNDSSSKGSLTVVTAP